MFLMMDIMSRLEFHCKFKSQGFMVLEELTEDTVIISITDDIIWNDEQSIHIGKHEAEEIINALKVKFDL